MKEPNRLMTEREQKAELVEKEQRRRKIRDIAIIIGIIAIILLMCRCCGCQCNTEPLPDPDVPKINIDPNAVPGNFDGLSPEEIEKLLNEKVEEGMMNIHMLVSPVFEDGKAMGNIGIYVEPQNREPQMVQIIRQDTGDILYQSGLIPIGSRIEKGRLKVDLGPGVYPCIARFHRINEETSEVLGIAEHEIMVTVLN